MPTHRVPGDSDNPDVSSARRESLFATSGGLAPGARLGPYEIRAAIGAGGMGEVYRAYDTRLARDVALKVLPTDVTASPEALERFEREARAVAALNHPNILAIHDVGAASGIHFAVTELLEGETLRARLAARQITPTKALEYAAQIARGLAAAHERGIVHRDLKPENVFVTSDGRVKILDFGVAMQQRPATIESDETAAPLTVPGVIVGTVGYVSPEQVLGNPASARSDLFALGVVIYEMLTGTHPFRRATMPETLTAVLREDPAALRGLRGVPAAAIRMVELCLQKHPSDRPESARDLALFFDAVGTTGFTAGPAAAEPTTIDSLRTPAALVTLGFALVALLSGVMWAVVRATGSRAVAESVEADLTRAEHVVRRVHREHLQRLALTAQLVASFPELKALFATDVATVEDFLLAYRQRTPGTPLLVALGPEGVVLARTDAAGQRTESSAQDWLGALASDHSEGTIVAVGDRPYLAVAAPSEAAGTLFGYVVAAEAITQPFAQALREATQDEVVLLSAQQVLSSTLRDVQTPWNSIKAWRDNGGGSDRVVEVEIGGSAYAAREVVLTTDPAVSAVVVKSRQDARAPYARIERRVLLAGIVAAGAVLLAGVWLSRRSLRASAPAA